MDEDEQEEVVLDVFLAVLFGTFICCVIFSFNL